MIRERRAEWEQSRGEGELEQDTAGPDKWQESEPEGVWWQSEERRDSGSRQEEEGEFALNWNKRHAHRRYYLYLFNQQNDLYLEIVDVVYCTSHVKSDKCCII